MPAAALMIALTPHMAQLAHAVEDHLERSASPAASTAGSGSHSPSRVTFSVERRPPGFAPARHTSCTVVAEIVVRGVLDPATAAATGTAPGPFEQLIWSRRFKVGKAAREGETILEHRVVTVPVPEELFRYAERYDDLVAPEAGEAEGGADQIRGESRRMRKLRKQVERHAFKVAPVPDPPAEDDDYDGDGYQQQKQQRRGAPAMHPKKSDLYAQEELDAQFAVVDQLPDGCTFHLMCALEIVRDTQRAGEDPYLMRRGAYETAIDPAALLAADSSLLPLEMFAPFVEETGGGAAVDGSSSAVDIVAFASVFAVVGDQLAAATHGDESNPSLVSSFLALALAAQYDHLVFNVFRPELSLYRQGLQMALSRRGLSSGSPPTAAAVPTASRQQQPQAQQQQHSSPSPSRPPPPERDPAFIAQRQQQQQQQRQPAAAVVSSAPVASAPRQQAVPVPAFAAARRSQQQQDPQEVEERGPRSPSTRGAALGESAAPAAAVQQQQTLPSRRAVLRRDEDAERERSYLQPATVSRSSAAAQRPSSGSTSAAASSSRADVLQSILRKKQPQQHARDGDDEW